MAEQNHGFFVPVNGDKPDQYIRVRVYKSDGHKCAVLDANLITRQDTPLFKGWSEMLMQGKLVMLEGMARRNEKRLAALLQSFMMQVHVGQGQAWDMVRQVAEHYKVTIIPPGDGSAASTYTDARLEAKGKG